MHTSRLLLVLAAFLALPALSQEKGPVYFSVTVDAGRWQALELRNLPSQVKLTVDISTDGGITALVVNSEGLKKFPDIDDALFIGAVDATMNFTVTTPSANDYYVVLYNDEGQSSRRVKLAVRAARGEEPEPAAARLL